MGDYSVHAAGKSCLISSQKFDSGWLVGLLFQPELRVQTLAYQVDIVKVMQRIEMSSVLHL